MLNHADELPFVARAIDWQTALEELTSAVEDLDLGVVSGDYGSECLGGDHAIEPLRLLLLRFLRGNGFSVQKALSQVRCPRGRCRSHQRRLGDMRR